MPVKTHKQIKSRETFSIILPATSANIGPAFDAAALAMSMFLRVRAKAASDFSIIARGRDAEVCGEMKDHLILDTYRETLRRERRRILPLALRIDNEIPIGKGCGSSAAARMAGIILASRYGKLGWSGDRIIVEAAQREGHADNAAACWMGGLAIARISEDGEAHIACILPKNKWPLLLVVPEESLPTEHARRVLPKRYSRADAVSNIQNSMLLVAAFTQGRGDLLAAALHDRVHQPYRAGLCPLLPALQPLAKSEGILGVVLSGAGPSVLVFLNPKARVRNVKELVRKRLAARGFGATLIVAAITSRGGRTKAGRSTPR
jgi:homoserine kinase